MKTKIVRDVLCWGIAAVVPVSLMAAGSGIGTVHPYGTAWLNGAAVERSAAIFPGDLVQTSANSALKISSAGSSVTVLSDSLVKFEAGAVSVQHGGVKLATSNSMAARAGTVTVTPASDAWTEFEMTEANGKTQVVALKGDLQISNGSHTTILLHGQQATQMDSTGAPSSREQIAMMGASASQTAITGFVLGPATNRSTEALSRTVDAAATRGVEVVKAQAAIHISPLKP